MIDNTKIYFTYLFWHLSKVVDEGNGSSSISWIINLIKINRFLVEEMMEDIVSINSSLSLLFVTKYKVNPFMEMRADVVTL